MLLGSSLYTYIFHFAFSNSPQGPYQLDLVTPGISPLDAILRKQIRHSENFRRYARGLPQTRQRFRALTLYFGSLFAFSIKAVLAIPSP